MKLMQCYIWPLLIPSYSFFFTDVGGGGNKIVLFRLPIQHDFLKGH